jgi:intein/homing endonuclease
VRQKNLKNKFGSPTLADASGNCAICALRDVCKDPKKKNNYCCSLFYYEDKDKSSRDFAAWLRDLAKSESIVSDSWNIDDRDAPLAPNFYRFCTSEKWLGAKPLPFPWQLEVGCRIFGDCLAGDTRITTSKGIVEIKDLVPGKYTERKEIEVLGIDNKFHTVSAGGIVARKRIYRIDLGGNVPLRTTQDHRILTIDSSFRRIWKYVIDLNIGDFVIGTSQKITVLERKLPTNFEPVFKKIEPKLKFKLLTKVTPELARLIGYLMSDGSYSNYCLRYTSNDDVLLNDFVKIIKKLFNYKAWILPDSRGKKAKTVHVNSFVILDYLKFLGLDMCLSENKKVPKFILEAPEECQRHFIRAVFDSDGSFSIERIRLGMTAKHVIISIADMFRNMNISYRYYDYKRIHPGHEDYNLHIQNSKKGEYSIRKGLHWLLVSDAVKFKNEIGSIATDKAVNLVDFFPKRKTVKGRIIEYTMRSGLLPYGKGLVQKILNIKARNYYYYKSKNHPTIEAIKHHDSRSFMINLNNINSDLLPKPYNKRFKILKKRLYTYHEVKRIEPENYEDVYDLTVPETESFVANGLIVHNCCPWCSDQKWYKEIPFDCDPLEIPEHIRLRKNGICPECNRTILDGIKAGREHDVQNYIGIVGQRCITGDTILLTDRGLVRIGDYAPLNNKYGWHKEFKIHTYNHNKRGGRKYPLNISLETGSIVKVDKFWVSKPEKIRLVKFSNGSEIKGTNDHPIMTLKGWKNLSEISVGDNIAIYFNQNIWGNSTEIISENTAKVIGFWVAEGSASNNNFHVTNYDDTIRNLCRKEILLIDPRDEIIERKRSDGVDGYRCIKSTSKVVYAKMDRLCDGLFRKSAEKIIPRSILEAPKHIVCAFLQGLFEGDGHVESHGVGYVSISKKLVMQINTILLNMGIVSKIYKKYTWAINGSAKQISKPAWYLFIAGNVMVKKFQQEIGFFSIRKQQEVINYLADIKKLSDQPFFWNKLPHNVKMQYLQFIERIDNEWANIRIISNDQSYFTVKANFRYVVEDWRRLLSDNVSLSKIRLQRYWEKLKKLPQWFDLSMKLRNDLLQFHDIYLNPNCFWVSVTSNKQSRNKHKTYDIHVPEHHRFVANGILNHNSGKCLVESTLINTDKGLLPIKDVKVGDQVVVKGKLHPVTEIHTTRAKKVGILTTKMGYSIEGTPDHQIFTLDGWQPLKDAKIVLLHAEEHRPWSEEYANDYIAKTLGDTNAHFSADLNFHWLNIASNSPRSIATKFVKSQVIKESIGGKALVLEVYNCKTFQQSLLSFGIFCKQEQGKIVIDSPWAKKYDDEIGVDNVIVKNFVQQAISETYATRLNPLQCQYIAQVLTRCNLNESMVGPTLKSKMQIFLSCALHNTLTHKQIEDGMQLLQAFPLEDAKSKEVAMAVLSNAVNTSMCWTAVANFKRTIRTKVYDITVPTISSFVANGIYAHNSTGIGFPKLYLLHKLLKKKNPSQFYGIKANTVLDMHFVGINFTNARKFMFGPMLATYNDSFWFQEYNKILDDVAKKRGEKDIYKVKDTFIYYRPAAIRLEPKSPSTRSLRGSTRISFVVDELGQFSENKDLINISGIEIWNAMRNSLQTIRPEINRLRKEGLIDIPPSLALAISSPRDVADPIMILRNQYKKSADSYTILRETWNANPNLTFEFLQNEIKDPVSLWRDFGCRPPFSESAFIAKPEYLFNAIDESYIASTRQETIFLNTSLMNDSIRVTTVNLKFRRKEYDVPKIMAFDAGREFNAFAVCIGYLNEKGKFVIDSLTEVRPRPGAHVSFSEIYKRVFEPLIENLNVIAIASDRWQNAKFIDDAQKDYPVLRNRVVECRLNYDDFQQFRDDLINGIIVIPKPEISNEEIIDIDRTEEEFFDDRPIAQFIRQSLRVVDEPGKTVSKPSVGNDDIFRAVVVAVTAIKIPEIARVMRQGKIKNRTIGAIGVATFGSQPNFVKPIATAVATKGGFALPEESLPDINFNPIFNYKPSLDGLHKIRKPIKQIKSSYRRK